MKSTRTKLLIILLFFCKAYSASAQLTITPHPNATALAQKLVGDGVLISNVTFTGVPEMASFFNNNPITTNINIDSGIVLTSGRAGRGGSGNGVEGNGFTPAQSILASTDWRFPGDPDLAAAIGANPAALHDACVLEFDFIPLGDSIRFNYTFSSEEYTPAFVCTFNDAFAFFISGPGIPGLRNIALVPNTTIPVSIFNVNAVPGGSCPNNRPYYIDGRNNTYFTHDGHTTVLTALERVIPCSIYHLKLVISDFGDGLWDSGVFLQAKSLSSNVIGLSNQTQTDPVSGKSYLAEGCATGAFTISRPKKDPIPLTVNLSYGGTAINGVDVLTLPTSVDIPANDSFVTVNVVALADGLPEGIEDLKIYALTGCNNPIPSDSSLIQIRDYDILPLTPDTAIICRGASVQLNAAIGYSLYQWLPDPTLSSLIIPDPIATPVNSRTTYTCTATTGACNARDSVFLKLKDLELVSIRDVYCRNGSNGRIKVSGGSEWIQPVQFSLDGINWQPDSAFGNLTAGNYWVKIRDANCIDSLLVTVQQAFPDLLISNIAMTPASCSGNPDGTITVTGSGGNNVYLYSSDGINFQAGNSFNLTAGPYPITIKDGNGCLFSQNAIVSLNNTVTVNAGRYDTICNGTTYLVPAVSNGTSFSWSPGATLNDSTILVPTASPSATTMYYLIATTGICSRTDSIELFVRPAPVADAGPDVDICYGIVFQLHGSGALGYQWSPSTYFLSSPFVQDPRLRAAATITYLLHVTDIFSCRSIIPDSVKINVTPPVRIFAGNDTIAAINQPLQLKASELGIAGVISYTWTPASFLTNPNTASPVATLTSDQLFTVVGTTATGCQGIDEILVKVYRGPEIYVPSGFTPNNDGLNDLLTPVVVGIKEFRFFRIFNRWGQQIFFTKDPKHGWDGKINGALQPTGTFMWFVEGIDYKGNLITRKGVVTIIR